MAECMTCANPKHDDAAIKGLRYNETVKPGDEFTIEFNVESKSKLYGDTIHVSVIDDDGNDSSICIYDDEFTLAVGESVHQIVRGIMPDRDLNVSISLLDVNPLYSDDCEDVKHFRLKRGEETTQPRSEWMQWFVDHKIEIAITIILLIIIIIYFKRFR